MPFETVELDAKQEKLWSETRVALLWQCPAFSHILYSLLDNVGSKHIAIFTKGVPIAATDGKSLLFNPDTFFTYNLNKRVFIVAHEIMHCILNHCLLGTHMQKRGKVSFADGTELPYHSGLMNIATDLVINDLLIESKVGEYDKAWLHDTSIGTKDDNALDVYRKLFKKGGGGKGGKKPPQGGQGRPCPDGEPGDGKGDGEPQPNVKGDRFDEHLKPGTSEGKSAEQAAAERNETQWRTEVAAAMNAARVQGRLPAAMDRALSDILEPKVDWREHIQALFARRVGTGSYDWRKLDRRLIVRGIGSPGRSGFGADTVVVGVDTSGSVGDKEVNMFLAEIAGILEDVRPRRVLIAWCDAKLHRVDEADEPGDLNEIRHKGAPGGGGTSFVPVFDWMKKENITPDALIYLTDGVGSFPQEKPSYPVIWGSIYPQSKYPFGDVVDIPVGA